MLLKVIMNYKKAYEAMMIMRVLVQSTKKFKANNKKGPKVLYGKLGQVANELVQQYTEAQN